MSVFSVFTEVLCGSLKEKHSRINFLPTCSLLRRIMYYSCVLAEKIKETQKLICRLIFKTKFDIIFICSLSIINIEHLRRREQMCICKEEQYIMQLQNAFNMHMKLTFSLLFLDQIVVYQRL